MRQWQQQIMLHSKGDFPRLTGYFALAFVIPAVAIVLHEMGHFAAHAAFGFETNRLGFASVIVGAPPPGVDPRLINAISTAAGGLVSLLLLGAAVLSVFAFGPNPLALGITIFETIRVVLGFTLSLKGAGLRHTFTDGFGELRQLSALFGDPIAMASVTSFVELILPFVALSLIMRRFPQRRRSNSLAAVFLGVLGGLSTWIFWLGPLLLPG